MNRADRRRAAAIWRLRSWTPQRPPGHAPNRRLPQRSFRFRRERPNVGHPIPFLPASWRRLCSIQHLPPSFEPLFDGDDRALSYLRLDGELIHQAFDARQSQAQPAGCRVAIAQHVLDAADARPAVASAYQDTPSMSDFHALNHHFAPSCIHDDISGQFGNRRGNQCRIRCGESDGCRQ